jgi:hypothetical protein
VDTCCRELLDYLDPIAKALSVEISTLQKGKNSSSTYILCHSTVDFCIDESLVDLLIYFVIELQSWGITSDPTPSVQLRLRTWGIAMDVIFRLFVWARVIQEEYPHPSMMLIKRCLASKKNLPGGTK